MDNSDKVPASARDGLIDFGGYTTEQLVELESSIDPERFPRNHARLVEELNRRKRTEASNSPPRDRWDIRFSRSESFWSWVQAKRRRQWFYGRGFLEIQPAEIVLRGWQRTWLGMPVQGERRIALESIRNVGRDNATVLINVAGWSQSGRKLEFDCDSPESALSLCGRLPPVRDSVFEREWQEMRAFHGALYAPGNYPWGATALVLINVLVFLVFFINTKGWFGVQPQLLTVWGSNYGPLTVGGQWWRLLYVNIKLNLGQTRGEIKSVFDDGIYRFPDFLPLYRAVLRAFMPRWGGSYEKVNELIDDAASRRGSAAGVQMYARLYWAYASLEGDDVDIFTDSMASWPRMSDGFDLMLKQYPHSDYLMNGYAYMACRAGDSETYHALSARLKDRLSSTAWSARYSPEGCDKKFTGNGV